MWLTLSGKHPSCTAVSSSKSGEECYFSRLSFCYKPNILKAKVKNPDLSFFFSPAFVNSECIFNKSDFFDLLV